MCPYGNVITNLIVCMYACLSVCVCVRGGGGVEERGVLMGWVIGVEHILYRAHCVECPLYFLTKIPIPILI